MPDLVHLPTRDAQGNLRAVVETPRGSSVKIKFDPELSAFMYSRPLVLGLSYPCDFGFFPSTIAPDGDPLDVMIYHDAATYPGVVVPCRLVGVIGVSQASKSGGRERNDRVIAVPLRAPRYSATTDLPLRVREELEQFFMSAVLLSNKQAQLEGWQGAEAALELVAAAEQAFAARSSKP